MAEEHRCRAPRLCVNNCRFFGSPATESLYSKCHRDLQLQQQQQSSAKHALNQSLTAAAGAATTTTNSTTGNAPSSSSTSSSHLRPAADSLEPRINQTVVIDQSNHKKEEAKEEARVQVQEPIHQQQKQPTNRCLTCRKRVGLTGFNCRCGSTFCGAHRYPENHGCAFDFKALGKEQIARENPIVKADKLLEKI